MSIWLDAKQIADRLGVTLAVLQRIAELAKLQGIIDDAESESGLSVALNDEEHEPPTLPDHIKSIVAENARLASSLAAVKRQRDELVAAVLPVLEKIEPKPSPFQPLLMALVAAVKAAEQPKPIEPAPCVCCDKPASHIGSDGRQRCSEHTLNGDQLVGGA